MDKNRIAPDSTESQGLKTCTKCGDTKPATPEFFHVDKHVFGGIRGVCKVCTGGYYAKHKDWIAAQRKEHYHNNQEELLAKNRKKYANNHGGIQELAKERYQKNRDKLLIANRARHHKNKEAANEISRHYHAANREISNAKRRKYYADHRAEANAKDRVRGMERHHRLYGKDPTYTLRTRMSALVRYSLKYGRKSKSIDHILGYTMKDLRSHIEGLFTENMSWEALLCGDIHIDHIRPIASFDIKSIDDPDFKKCWGLENLQPLWAFDNLSKGSKYSE